MGSSGSLSQALSYGKPFMVSSKMQEILRDMPSGNDYVFHMNKQGMVKIVNRVKNEAKLADMGRVAGEIARARNLVSLARVEYRALYAPAVR